ncbi:hypothetical protein GW17_00025037 [Ensete ventricosum]|nr:hypothetical protein GW17_00025037 [Ensete ventricosum]
MSGNPNPAADAKPAGAGRFRGLGIHHLADEHHVLPSVILPAQIDDPSAVGRSGELIAAADAQTLQQYHEADHSSGSHGIEEDGVGAVDNEGMETEEPADPSHLGDAHGLIAPQVGGNQLTLSFQGEVFVFDSVSPEKVRMNVPHRVASLMRFREKRKERNFEKKIRYTVRKEVALRRKKKGRSTSCHPRSRAVTSCGSLARRRRPRTLVIFLPREETERLPMQGERSRRHHVVLYLQGIMRDLSKNPSPAIPNASPEPKEGVSDLDIPQNNSGEAAIAQSIAVAANGHDTS